MWNSEFLTSRLQESKEVIFLKCVSDPYKLSKQILKIIKDIIQNQLYFLQLTDSPLAILKCRPIIIVLKRITFLDM